MCNFSLDGTQAKGYSSYSPLSPSPSPSLSLSLSPSLLGCFHTPSLLPSLPSSSCSLMSPFHYQPSIYQPFPFFFFLRSDFPHTQFWTGVLWLWLYGCPVVTTMVCVCVCVTCAPDWAGGVFGSELKHLCVFVLTPALLHFQTILMPCTTAMHPHISFLTGCTHINTHTGHMYVL